MKKFRIWELAREYGKNEKEIIHILEQHNITVKSHLSSVDENVKKTLDDVFKNKTSTTKVEKKVASKNLQTRKRRPARMVRFDEKSGKPKEEFFIDGKGRRIRKKKVQKKQPEVAASLNKEERTAGQEPQNQKAVSSPISKETAKPKDSKEMVAKKHVGKDENEKAAKTEVKEKMQPAASRKVAQETKSESNEKQMPNQEKESPKKQQEAESKPSRTRNKGKGQERSAGRNVARREAKTKGGRGQNNRRKKGTSLLAESIRKSKSRNRGRNTDKNAGKEIPTEVAMPPSVTVKELAELFHTEVSDIIKRLMLLGIMATINEEVDRDAVEILADEYGIELKELPPEEDKTIIPEIIDDPSTLLPRPPVVTIMGHVDHGKTSLLDAIRKANVTAREAGGITQHIGAYQVRCQGKKVVFLDTPGHEAFTSMRARGAQVTDVAVLVVAADDGVMPQTIEAINHAKAADVPIVVAINKMDKPTANPDHVKQQLAEHGLLPEEWGGDVIMVPVSAKKGMGMEDLLESILLVAEVLELKANPNRAATGVVVEGELDKGRGPVVTVLVQNGTLRIGDGIIAGTAFGRVRAMINEKGDSLKKAEPSTPVEVLGLSEVPTAGELIYAMDEREAREIAEKRIDKAKIEEQNRKQKITLDDLFTQIKEGELKNLNIIIKADVQGSVEALRQSFEAIKNPEVRIDIIHAGVGAITESDIMLASAGNALIIGFNVRPDANIRKIAENEQVELRTYRVIYDAIDNVKMAMQGMLSPKYREVVLGRAEVRQVIPTPKVIVAGSYVTEGKITNSSELRLIRDGIVVHEGKIASLRRFKDDVKEVPEGYECGISIESYRDVKEGDVLEAFIEEEIEQVID